MTNLRGDTRLRARHLPSGLNDRFVGEQLSFAEYVSRTRSMLRNAHAARKDADNASNLDKIVDGNAPFELKPVAPDMAGKHKPYRRGILLTHGLTDSPYFMRHLATFFEQNGFRVLAILLPGHGTQPGDLLDVRWQDWADAVAFGVDRLAEESDEIYLAGYSAGAALSVYQSLNDDRVLGLFLFSPALEISRRAAVANLHKLYSWLVPSAEWLEIKPDIDIYKYESFPKNAAAQMYALTRAINNKLQNRGINIPVFTAASADDKTVNTKATLEFMAHANHASSKLVLYTTDMGHPPKNINAKKIELVNSVIPEQRILNSAHTSIVLPPEDAHYGVRGKYSNCIHYYPENMEKYAVCLQSEQVNQGEITEKNLQIGTLRRLMYNPHSAGLKDSMQRFIDNL